MYSSGVLLPLLLVLVLFIHDSEGHLRVGKNKIAWPKLRQQPNFWKRENTQTKLTDETSEPQVDGPRDINEKIVLQKNGRRQHR